MHFQLGEGPNRGLLRDCEIFANLHLAFVSSSSGYTHLVVLARPPHPDPLLHEVRGGHGDVHEVAAQHRPRVPLPLHHRHRAPAGAAVKLCRGDMVRDISTSFIYNIFQ